MWGKKRTLAVPDDVDEARAIRVQTTAELRTVRGQTPFIQRMADGLIDRRGRNHYIELLYKHAGGA